MKTYLFILLGISLVVGAVFFLGGGASNQTDPSLYSHLDAVVYKTPSCGCCHVFAQYLKGQGASVETKDLNDLSDIKSQYGIPRELESCHTSVVNEYVVEGHIPVEVIAKLVAEKPDIKGIALPGMPSGSPGMPGPKIGKWTIFALYHDGTTGEYMQY